MSNLNPNKDQLRQNPYPDDEIDLKELFMVLWRGKWLISAVTGLAAVFSVIFALSLPNIYTASAVLAPAESSGGGLSGLMKQYGGLASFAGVSLPDGEEGSRAQLGMQLMQSRVFIGDFVERHDILPELMAVEAWDPLSGELNYDASLYDSTSKVWVRGVAPPRGAKPSALEAHSAFSAALSVSKDPETGFVSVSFEHRSPIVAAQWVNWLVADTNASVRAKEVEEAQYSIEYLKQQVENTSLADLQAIFFELIQRQIETVMLAEVRPEYVFKTIDPAVPPEIKSGPNRALICIFGTLISAFLAVLGILTRHYT